jgi:hypothetical protein
LSPAEDTLLLKGGLIVIKLEIRKIGEVDREIEGKISVRVPHEVEACPPLMELSFQSDHLRLELAVRDIELRGPGQ